MFCGYTKESEENKLIEITINDIEPNAFRVFLRWLYGQSFEEAKNSILCKPTNFNSEKEDYDSYYLSFLVNLLKITDGYEGETLKNLVQSKIKSRYINFNNVCEIREWAINYNALRLKERCDGYIELNKKLIVEKRLEFCENATNEEERSEERQMLNSLLNN